MKLGMIGLGKMGGSMAARLVASGHEVVGIDPDEDARAQLREVGGGTADDAAALVGRVPAPRVVWMMLPAGRVIDEMLDELVPALDPGDVVVDGGNSFYKDTLRRAARLSEHELHLVDVGVSGGVWGREHGYSLMVGGAAEAVERLRPAFVTLAPAPDAGWGHVGPPGAGHFVKMVHNGIEYGLMQAYAEGFALLRHKPEFDLDLHQVAEIWRDGSVVRSWLLDLVSRALAEDAQLADVAAWVPDSGEGRWTVAEAIEQDVPAPVITLALLERLASRTEDSYTYKVLSALRGQFGGHAVKGAR